MLNECDMSVAMSKFLDVCVPVRKNIFFNLYQFCEMATLQCLSFHMGSECNEVYKLLHCIIQSEVVYTN